MQTPSYDTLEGTVRDANIYRRNGGCAVQVDGKVYVWGGEGSEQRRLPAEVGDDEEDEDDSEEEEEEIVDLWTVTVLPPLRFKDKGAPFDVYDMRTRTWSRIKTTGDAPSLGLGSSLVYHPDTHTIYLFGGFNAGHFDANVYRVKVGEWKWQKVEIGDGRMKPSGRYLTGVVVHKSHMCALGGVGTNIVKRNGIAQDPGAKYVVAHAQGEGFGWNNEYYEFDMESDEWNAPLDQDACRPEPLGGHCFVKFDTHRALLFGGRYESGRKNDTWIFDLEQRKFTEVKFFESDSVPTGRVFATLTPLIDPLVVGQKLGGCKPVLHQRMLLLWGKQQNDVILPETWTLEIHPNDQLIWKELSVNLLPRSWHTTSPLYYYNSTECQLAIFGGNAHFQGFVGKRRNIGDIRVLSFGVMSLSRLCAQVIARDGRDITTFALSPNFLPYKLIDRAIQTLRNSKPITMEHVW